jgi:8-oxo-dGTP diphosphatase
VREVASVEFERMLKVGAAAIVRESASGWELLTARRTEPPVAAGLWEFPGGKIDPGEFAPDAVRREIREELGVAVDLREQIVGPLHGFWQLTDRIAFELWLCTIVDDAEPVILEDHDALAWLGVDALFSVPWIPADAPLVRLVGEMLGRANASGGFPSSSVA